LARRSQRSTRRKPHTAPRSLEGDSLTLRVVRDIAGLVAIALGLIIAAGVFSAPVGRLGGAILSWLTELVGDAKLGVAIALVAVGYSLLVRVETRVRALTGAGWTLLLIGLVTILHMRAYAPGYERLLLDPGVSELDLPPGGGLIGAVVTYGVRGAFGEVGAYVFVVVFMLSGIAMVMDTTVAGFFRWLWAGAKRAAALGQSGAPAQEKRPRRETKAAPNVRVREDEPDRAQEPDRKEVVLVRGPKVVAEEAGAGVEVEGIAPVHTEPPEPLPPAEDLVELAARADDAGRPFVLPPIELLKTIEPPPQKRIKEETEENIRILEETLESFHITAKVVEIARGPTVTRYEIQLAPGIKVRKIVDLADNIAMSLAARNVRVEAPIPGKSAIGIEVPNRVRAFVALREVLERNEFAHAESKLTFALGKDVAGTCKYADLSVMPHLLICGATASGKSVCLNSLIISLLYRCTPSELRFLLIDPKRVELSLFDGIPHLVAPVVRSVKQAAGAFRWALKEMERRYDLFVQQSVRNIESYNQRVRKLRSERAAASPDGEVDDPLGRLRDLPYLVVVVDELADLMSQAGAEVETSITRLAQLARATGIHLVIATQRPSVDVITGTIKANIRSRIAFAVSTQVDSRTILDMPGAERLIGNGDMLYLPFDEQKPIRLQGAFVSEEEANGLVSYLKTQAQPIYDDAVLGRGEPMGTGSEDYDELFEPAVRLIVTTGHASTSMIQRKFKIGYTRAARLVDMMEQRGIVSELDGSKPRTILVAPDEIEPLLSKLSGE
jgi:S-DNA-T family DNA segregation ATPase FtsK/SpoIIIE